MLGLQSFSGLGDAATYGVIAHEYAAMFPNLATCEKYVPAPMRTNICQFATDDGEGIVSPLASNTSLFLKCVELCHEHSAHTEDYQWCEDTCLAPFTNNERKQIKTELSMNDNGGFDLFGLSIGDMLLFGGLGVGAYFLGKEFKKRKKR